MKYLPQSEDTILDSHSINKNMNKIGKKSHISWTKSYELVNPLCLSVSYPHIMICVKREHCCLHIDLAVGVCFTFLLFRWKIDIVQISSIESLKLYTIC